MITKVGETTHADQSIASQRHTSTPALPWTRRTVCATWSNRSNMPIRRVWNRRTPPSGVPRFRPCGHSRRGGGTNAPHTFH